MYILASVYQVDVKKNTVMIIKNSFLYFYTDDFQIKFLYIFYVVFKSFWCFNYHRRKSHAITNPLVNVIPNSQWFYTNFTLYWQYSCHSELWLCRHNRTLCTCTSRCRELASWTVHLRNYSHDHSLLCFVVFRYRPSYPYPQDCLTGTGTIVS